MKQDAESKINLLPITMELQESDGNLLIALLDQWHKLEPLRVRKYEFLWTLRCEGFEHDLFAVPESLQDRAVIQYVVQTAVCDRNWCSSLESGLTANWIASVFLPTPSYCIPLGNAEHEDRVVALLTAYTNAVRDFNVAVA